MTARMAASVRISGSSEWYDLLSGKTSREMSWGRCLLRRQMLPTANKP